MRARHAFRFPSWVPRFCPLFHTQPPAFETHQILAQASSAAQSGGANLETPGSDPRTGLSSLPPLSPGVEPHRMTVSTVPARLTDEVFRLYVKYQVQGPYQL